MLSYGEIASAVSEVDVDEGDIEELYGHIEKNGIELVEDRDPGPGAVARRRRSPTASAAAAAARPRST